jgi:hypothetical protein
MQTDVFRSIRSSEVEGGHLKVTPRSSGSVARKPRGAPWLEHSEKLIIAHRWAGWGRRFAEELDRLATYADRFYGLWTVGGIMGNFGFLAMRE